MNRTAPRRLPETAEAQRIEEALLKLMRQGQTLGKLFVFPEKTLAKAKDLSKEDRRRIKSAVDGLLLALALDRESGLKPGIKTMFNALPPESVLHVISVMSDDCAWQGISPPDGRLNTELHAPLFLNVYFG